MVAFLVFKPGGGGGGLKKSPGKTRITLEHQEESKAGQLSTVPQG